MGCTKASIMVTHVLSTLATLVLASANIVTKANRLALSSTGTPPLSFAGIDIFLAFLSLFEASSSLVVSLEDLK